MSTASPPEALITAAFSAGLPAIALPSWSDLPPLDLPTPLPRAHATPSNGNHVAHAAHRFNLPFSLVKALLQLHRAGNGTSSHPETVLIAAFALFLHRYSGKDMFAIAVPGPRGDSSDPAIRLRIDPEATFAQLLALVRHAAAYAAVPPASISPVTAAIVIGRPGDAPPELSLLAARYELVLSVTPSDEDCPAALVYSPALFTAAAIGRAADHLLHLLRQAVERPGSALDRFSLITPAERTRIDLVFNATRRERESSLCLHQLFERQAQITPGHIAVLAGEASLTYAEANQQANRIARTLRRIGVTNGSTVGLLLERSAIVIPAILGILKAGAVYVPLDPAYPAARLSTILEDCAPACVLTDAAARRSCPGYAGRMVEVAEILRDPAIKENNLRVPVAPPDLAYLIYTSGSTGRPKGVMIEHRSAAEMVAWALAEYPARMLRNVLASTSLCFDLSIFEIFVPLSSGNTVVMSDDLLAWSEAGMPGGVSLINTVPSALKELSAAGRIPSTVLAINVAGEPLPEAFVAAAWQASGNLQAMYNLYGPSEDTTYSTFARVIPNRPVMIGRPVDNSATYVLDRFGHLLPVGIPGELWIGGAGLARGYWRQPEMTAERFLPNHVGGQPGTRLYRTGDLARWTDEGDLEFLGRIDHQVKIRGHRIELGEIETLLDRHRDVERAVVAAIDSPAGDKRLAAYVVLRPGRLCETAALIAYLKARLPKYMCPAAVLVLPALPLTSNGKVDRKRLPAPDWNDRETQFAAPSTPEEHLLCRIWSDVLAVDRVGVGDDFFALGGHSLLAMRVVSHVRAELGAHLPLRLLFEHPALASLAAELARLRHSTTQTPFSPATETAILSSPQTVSFGEQRMFLLTQMEPESAKYNMAYAIHIAGPLDAAALARALTRFAARHQVLACRFELHGDLVRVPCSDGLPLRSLAVATDAELDELIAAEPLAPFSFDHGLLWRVLLLQRHVTRSVLVITLHHAIADDWSMTIWAREMGELYAAEVSRREPSLPPPSPPYSAFAQWQRSREQQAIQASQFDYWAARLKDAPELVLPEARSLSSSPVASGAIFRFRIPARVAGRLKRLQLAEGSSLFMVVLAAFKVLLHRYSGGPNDLLVATPASNRSRAEFEHVFGYFLNTIVLRSTVSVDLRFRDYLRLVRDITLEAYASQDVPLDRVIQKLSPSRDSGADPGRTPLVHTAVIVQHAADAIWPLGELQANCRELFTPTAKFDLSLLVNEEPASANPETEGRPEAPGWSAMFEYSTRFFDQPAIERLSHQFLNILDQIGAAPDVLIAEIESLRNTAELALLRRLSGADGTPPDAGATPPSVHRWFEEQVLRTPEAAAVVFRDEVLTYGNLNQRANRLARELYARCGSGSRIAVRLERSLEMIVALLAILKTGSAFVPIDPTSPPARQRLMVRNAGAATLITHSALPDLGAISTEQDKRSSAATLPFVLPIDRFESPQTETDAIANLDLPSHPEAPFYLIYTSGSTGEPKSVCLPNRAMLNLLGWYGRSLARGVRILQFASICFDVASLEIFSALVSGGTVVLIDAATQRDPALLAPFIARAEIQQLFLPVVMLEALAGEAVKSGLAFPRLREVITAGEQLHITPAIREFFAANHASLHNHYGPSETHVITAFDMPRTPESVWPDRPSIGRPIDGCQAFVLDSRGQLAPIGVPGELCLGGPALAHGYWDRPDLTAERFVPDALSGDPGARLYRTGDLARWSPDGQLDFLHRIDHQVKVRGFRVEPGEIQAAILRHPAVKQALVSLHDPASNTAGSSEARLIAYLVLAGGHMVDVVHSLRESLPEILPDYMVPSAFVQLSALPVDANGKLDRRQLPAPLSAESSVAFAAPRTPTETVLAQLWTRTLDLPRVGIHDNFFQMGGHSFTAMQLAARIHETFHLRMPLHVIFSQPTIAQSARAIDLKLALRPADRQPGQTENHLAATPAAAI